MTEQDSCCSTGGSETTPKIETEGKDGVTKRKKLDILKDLPSFNKDNFSRYVPCGGTLNKTQRPKSYIWLKSQSKNDYKPQVIVMDSQSQIIRELESMVTQQQIRVALKRSSSSRSENGRDSQTESSSMGSCKLARTEHSDEESVYSLDI